MVARAGYSIFLSLLLLAVCIILPVYGSPLMAFFFHAEAYGHGPELWKSDGTEAGTVLVKDINPGPDGWRPKYLTAVGGTLFFQA